MKPTVHDIARSAGVSLATVDRVLNARPGVKVATRQRVEDVILSLGYVRDMAAVNLAKGRTYSFTFILPDYDNSFMISLRDEVQAASLRGGAERTALTVMSVPAFDGAALASALKAAAASAPDGIAFVAVDTPNVREAVSDLRADGLAVVTLVSDLSENVRDHYAGIDNLAAGRTAAGLMGRFVRGQPGPIAVMAGSMLVRDHRERLDGFLAGLAEAFPGTEVLPVMESRDEPATVARLVRDVLQRRDDLAGLYSLGAGNRGLVEALKDIPQKTRPAVICHELTEATRTALHAGLIDAVLNQDAGHEVRSALRVLKARVDGMPVIAAQERIRIDIFLKDNLP